MVVGADCRILIISTILPSMAFRVLQGQWSNDKEIAET
jgi:hypothetical protein